MTALLQVKGLAVSYGAVPAVDGVSLEILPGELRVILGANGAGKTTIIKTLFGLLRPRAGEVRFNGEIDLLRLKPHQIHMTILPKTSMMRVADASASAPGAATAAIVSPLIATSHLPTPCGVTTSPPRMIISSTVPTPGN